MARRPYDPSSAYFGEVGVMPLLAADEELALARRIAAGRALPPVPADPADDMPEHAAIRRDAAEARDHLIRANLRLVVSLIRPYMGRGLDVGDLIGHGNAGLCVAADRYDPGRNVRFSTYAAWWIKEAVREALRNRGTIRLPSYMVTLINRFKRLADRAASDTGCVPSEDEIIATMGLGKPQRRALRDALAVVRANQWIDSVSGCIDPDGRGIADSFLEDTPDRDPNDLPDPADLDRLGRCLARLDGRERDVIGRRFALDGECRPERQSQVGGSLGLTRSRVQQIEVKAIRKLRVAMREDVA